MTRSQRKRFFVDREVQGALTRRVAVYVWLVVVLIGLASAFWIVLEDGPLGGRQLVARTWARFGPAWVAALLLIPVVVFDCIRYTNRFAGPMLRLRRAMKDVAAGKDVDDIKFRKGDFWFEFAEDFNAMLLERKLGAMTAGTKETSSQLANSPLLSCLSPTIPPGNTRAPDFGSASPDRDDVDQSGLRDIVPATGIASV